VLTSNFLYEINCKNPSDYIANDFWDLGHTFKNFTVTPKGDPIFSDDYKIFTSEESFPQQKKNHYPDRFRYDSVQTLG